MSNPQDSQEEDTNGDTPSPSPLAPTATADAQGVPADPPRPALARRAHYSLWLVWLVPLIAVIIVLGFFPKPVLDAINPAITRTMLQVGVSDPAPTVAPAAEGTNP